MQNIYLFFHSLLFWSEFITIVFSWDLPNGNPQTPVINSKKTNGRINKKNNLLPIIPFCRPSAQIAMISSARDEHKERRPPNSDYCISIDEYKTKKKGEYSWHNSHFQELKWTTGEVSAFDNTNMHSISV